MEIAYITIKFNVQAYLPIVYACSFEFIFYRCIYWPFVDSDYRCVIFLCVNASLIWLNQQEKKN